MTPPRSMSPISTTGHVRRLGKAHIGDVAGAQIDLGRAAGALDEDEIGRPRRAARTRRAPPAAGSAPAGDTRRPRRCPRPGHRARSARRSPIAASAAPGSCRSTGSTPQARACNACARPISPPSAVTAALFDMFCGLNGRTLSPRRVKARASPASSSDLPTSEPVPCSISASAHQNSMPCWALTPARNGCLTRVISVTRSATSISSGLALRPVTTMCRSRGFAFSAATTSSSGR